MHLYNGIVPCPFIPDFNYRVKISFDDFTEGEIVRFKRAGHERYNCSDVYVFSVPSKPNTMRHWEPHNIKDWEKYFELVKSF